MRNEDDEDGDKEEYVGAPLSSTGDGSPGDKENEACKYDQEDDGIYYYEDTVLYDVKDNKEETSSGHKGESSPSRLLDISDNKGEEDERTSAEDINGNINGNCDDGATGITAQ